MSNKDLLTILDQNRAAERHCADQAIIETALPACYAAIDALLSAVDPKLIPKKLSVECRRLLPRKYANSFEAPKL